jgi:hypothetical protein
VKLIHWAIPNCQEFHLTSQAKFSIINNTFDTGYKIKETDGGWLQEKHKKAFIELVELGFIRVHSWSI